MIRALPLALVAAAFVGCQSNDTGYEAAVPPADYSSGENSYGYTPDTNYAGESAAPAPAPAPAPQQRGGLFSRLPHRDGAYIGLPLPEAQSLAQSRGLQTRVIMRDGVAQPGTTDVDPGRVNFKVNNGVVRAVVRG